MEQVTGVEPAYAAWEAALRKPKKHLFSGTFNSSGVYTSRFTSHYIFIDLITDLIVVFSDLIVVFSDLIIRLSLRQRFVSLLRCCVYKYVM